MEKLLESLSETIEIRKLLTELTNVCVQYGQDELEYVAQEREISVQVLKDSNLFLFTNETIFTLLYNQIVKPEYKEKLGIFNNEGFVHASRVVLPIFDQKMRVMTWVSWQKGKLHKYLTSKTFGFEKSSAFYGLEFFDEVESKGYAIVVEGMFDVLRWRSIGYYNVLGTMGNDLSLHKRLILNRAKKVIFFPDNDKGGKENSHKNEKSGFSDYRLWATDKHFVRVELKGKYKDCDDYFKVPENRDMAEILINTALTLKSGDVLEFKTT